MYIREKKKDLKPIIFLYLRKLEQKQQIKSKERKKIGAEINKIENRRSVEEINETKSSFFEKINKINMALNKLTKEKREWTQITNARNKRENITRTLKGY